MSAVYQHFNEQRASLPLMFIATPNSKMTSPFTRHVPTAQTLTRMAVLARGAFTVLEKTLIPDDSKPATSDIKV